MNQTEAVDLFFFFKWYLVILYFHIIIQRSYLHLIVHCSALNTLYNMCGMCYLSSVLLTLQCPSSPSVLVFIFNVKLEFLNLHSDEYITKQSNTRLYLYNIYSSLFTMSPTAQTVNCNQNLETFFCNQQIPFRNNTPTLSPCYLIFALYYSSFSLQL